MTNLGAKPAPNVQYSRVFHAANRQRAPPSSLSPTGCSKRCTADTAQHPTPLSSNPSNLFMKLWRLQSVCEVCITTSVSDQSQATVPPRRKEAVFILRPPCCLPSRLPSSRMTPNDRTGWAQARPSRKCASGHSSFTDRGGVFGSLGRSCASKPPLLCHAGVCELLSLGLNHSRVITSRPWSIAVSYFGTQRDPSGQFD